MLLIEQRGRLILGWAMLMVVLTAATPRARADKDLPAYVIESIEVRGNTKTKDYVIRKALQVTPGERLSVDDPRFELSRYRVLSLGFFSAVHLELKKGSSRGKVILVVNVVERGTIILSDIFFGSSEATVIWGGLGLSENNFLGRGINVTGAFVIGSNPDVESGEVQHAYRLQVGTNRLGGGTLSLSGAFTYLDGSDFFRKSGLESSSSPSDYLSLRYRRIGGTLGVGFDLSRYTRMYVDYRGEYVHSNIPAGAVRRDPAGTGESINFGIIDGSSALSLLAVTVELDTRSDPVLPHSGSLLSLNGQLSTSLIGSGYDYFKLTALFLHYFPLRWGHVLSVQVQGGVLFGDPPFFEKFFIGDYNDLVPGRALGLNFSTQPSRDFFGTAIDSKRYEEFALRTSLEYIIPWFRGGKFFYGGDFFLNLGLIMLTSREEIEVRDRDLSESIPVDLTLDCGLRLDTRIGVFRLSIGNAFGRIPF